MQALRAALAAEPTKPEPVGVMQESDLLKGLVIPVVTQELPVGTLLYAALVAAEKEQQMIEAGWRKCAVGQRTTQFCGLLDEAVKAEREACALFLESGIDLKGLSPGIQAFIVDLLTGFAAAIRKRGET